MIELLKRMFSNEKQSSKDVAKNRLKVVIMQDRTTFTPSRLKNLRDDLINVFSKYFEMDDQDLNFNIDQEGEDIGLSISIPIKKVKNNAAIDEDEDK